MKKLSEICKSLNIRDTNVNEDYIIEGIAINSKKVKKNYIFVETEGNGKYILDAVKNGAVIIVSDRLLDIPSIKVDKPREALAILSSEFFDKPQSELKIIGVVGTNGKTSVTHILSQILCINARIAVIGTLGIWIGGRKYENDMTTPDPPELFFYLKKAVESGVKYVLCEITAHAIYYQKFFGITAEICVFTNISRDHLDFFGTMDNYAKVKTDFFETSKVKFGVINADDEYGIKILNNGKICSVSYGINQPSDVFAINIKNKNGLEFIINAFDEIFYISSNLIGKFNVYNILAAVAVARLLGISQSDIISVLKEISPIEGRLNIINKNPCVIIDFAHTPDGLENVLKAVKEMTVGRVIAIYGCGGNRDKGKRPIMGQIGVNFADFCIFTSDNPRDEEPDDIINDIVMGVKDNTNYIIKRDRTDAIKFALNFVEKNDSIVICGKGGENYIEIKGKLYPYNDKTVCLNELEKLK